MNYAAVLEELMGAYAGGCDEEWLYWFSGATKRTRTIIEYFVARGIDLPDAISEAAEFVCAMIEREKHGSTTSRLDR